MWRSSREIFLRQLVPRRRRSYRAPMRIAALPLLLLALSGTASCAKAVSPPRNSEAFLQAAEAAYYEALESYHDQDWVAVPMEMGEVKREYAGTRWARLAQLRIADAQFHARSFQEAITAYREFLREFPNDIEVPYARYKVAVCQFEARGDSKLSPPLEERDLVNVREADASIGKFLEDYPNYPERENLLYMQSWTRGMLARHELYVARYYLDRDKLDAAIARTEYALVNYKSTGLEPEALVLLGETYMKKRSPEQAKAAFEIVLQKYPESPFAVPAQKFLTRLAEAPPLPWEDAEKPAEQ